MRKYRGAEMKEFVIVWYRDNYLVGKVQERKLFKADGKEQAKAMWDAYAKHRGYAMYYYGMYEIRR